MAGVDDVTAAVSSLDAAVDLLIAKATADAAVVPDFQPVIDAVDAITAKVNAFLTPAA
jgi:tRNA A37 threonylcarbamoyladenosine dehydratase